MAVKRRVTSTVLVFVFSLESKVTRTIDAMGSSGDDFLESFFGSSAGSRSVGSISKICTMLFFPNPNHSNLSLLLTQSVNSLAAPIGQLAIRTNLRQSIPVVIRQSAT